MPPTPRTCIVADDDPSVLEFMIRALSSENVQVFAASNGREAAAIIGERHCDVLVTDLAMPGGEGIETIRAIRKQHPHVKILAVTGAFGEDMLRVAEALGADASLAKPFSAETLVASVQALMTPAKGKSGG
jgi:DNA-binding response OmpR family regulator